MSQAGAGQARARFRAVLVFLTLAIVVFVPVLRSERVFCFRDLADYAIPHKIWAAGELLAGRVPLWNPWNYCGFPHLANLQSGALYPPNAVFMLLPFPIGFNLSLIVHFLIAAMGTRELCLRFGMPAGAALVGGLAYGFSPYLLSLTDLNAFLATASWLPWLLLAGLALGDAPTPRRIAWTALVFAMGFLAGEPQTLALGGLLAAAASAFFGGPASAVPRASPARLLRLAGAWAAAALTTVLLVAPVLLPFLELAGLSERSGTGLTREQVFRYSIEPRALPTLLFPGFSGDPVAGTHWLGEQTYVRRPYLGALVTALAIIGLAARGRWRWAFATVFALGLFLTLGPDGFVYPLLYDAGFRQSRFPVKFLIMSVLAVALLAAAGAHALGGRDAAAAVRRLWLTLGGILLCAIAIGVLVPAPPARSAALHVALVALAGLLLLFLARHRPDSRWPARLGCGLLAADLASAALPVLTTMPAVDLTAPAPALAAIQVQAEGTPGKTGEAGVSWPRIYTPPISARTLGGVYRDGQFDAGSLERKKALLFGNTNLLYALPLVRGGESMEVRDFMAVLDLVDQGPQHKPLLDLTGAGWLVTATADGEAQVTRNPDALPHAFLVGVVRRDQGEGLGVPGFDPRHEALFEGEIEGLSPDCVDGKAEILSSRPDELRVAVDSPGRCLLVVSDTFYPGWRATIDSAPAELLKVDVAFRGVLVESGRHEVRMEFHSMSFRRGVQLAGAGAVVLLALLLLGRREVV